MDINKILSSKKKEKLVLGIAVLFCFLVHVAVLRQFTNWYSTDVVGYLSHAATFSGRDWSGVMRNATSFYSWGYSILLTIPMLLTSDITLVYHCAILFNVFLSCGILLLCYGIGKRIAPEVNRYCVIICATAVSVYTSYIFQGAVMLSEIFLYFFVFLNVYCLLRYIETEKSIWGILTGFSVGYTYIIHNRAIAVVIAYVMVTVAWCIKERRWKRLLVMLAPLVFMLIIKTGLTEYLNLCEKQGQEYKRNTYDSQMNNIANKIHFYTIISMMKCAIGEIWYMCIGSFGIIPLGVYSMGKELCSCFKNKKKNAYVYIFSLLFLVGTLCVSILGVSTGKPLSQGGRYDLYIYGRYWETIFGVFLFVGFLECFKGIRRDVLIFVGLMSSFLSLIVEYMTRAYQYNVYNFWAIPAVLTTFFEPERTFTVYASSIYGLVVMSLLFYMIVQKRKICMTIGVMIWMFISIFTGYNAVYNVSSIYKEYATVVNMPFNVGDFNDVCSFIENNGIDKFSVYVLDGYQAVSFQIAFPDKEVKGVLEMENLEDGYCIIDKLSFSEWNQENVIYENLTYIILGE